MRRLQDAAHASSPGRDGSTDAKVDGALPDECLRRWHLRTRCNSRCATGGRVGERGDTAQQRTVSSATLTPDGLEKTAMAGAPFTDTVTGKRVITARAYRLLDVASVRERRGKFHKSDIPPSLGCYGRSKMVHPTPGKCGGRTAGRRRRQTNEHALRDGHMSEFRENCRT